MTERPEDAARRAAITVAEEVEGIASRVVDGFETLSLRVMEQLAGAAPRSEGVAELRRLMTRLRRLAAPVPHLAGRVAAGAYFGVRMGLEMYRDTQDGADEGRGRSAADADDGEP